MPDEAMLHAVGQTTVQIPHFYFLANGDAHKLVSEPHFMHTPFIIVHRAYDQPISFKRDQYRGF